MYIFLLFFAFFLSLFVLNKCDKKTPKWNATKNTKKAYAVKI